MIKTINKIASKKTRIPKPDDGIIFALNHPVSSSAPMAKDVSEIAEDIFKIITKSIEFSSKETARMLVLYLIMTWFIDSLLYVAYILILSNSAGCGKSSLLDTLKPLVNNPFKASSASSAGISALMTCRPGTTMLIDEFDNSSIKDSTMRAIINSGNDAEAGESLRASKDKKGNYTGFETKNSFGPKIFAGLSIDYPDTFIDRCLTIKLTKAKNRLVVNRYQRKTLVNEQIPIDLKNLAEQCSQKYQDILYKLKLPEEFSNRKGDKFHPLFALLKLSKNEKFKKTWCKSLFIYSRSPEYNDKPVCKQERFVKHVAELIKRNNHKGEYILTEQLLNYLNAEPIEVRKEFAAIGSHFTARRVGYLLGLVRIKPTKIPPTNVRGYRTEDFF